MTKKCHPVEHVKCWEDVRNGTHLRQMVASLHCVIIDCNVCFDMFVFSSSSHPNCRNLLFRQNPTNILGTDLMYPWSWLRMLYFGYDWLRKVVLEWSFISSLWFNSSENSDLINVKSICVVSWNVFHTFVFGYNIVDSSWTSMIGWKLMQRSLCVSHENSLQRQICFEIFRHKNSNTSNDRMCAAKLCRRFLVLFETCICSMSHLTEEVCAIQFSVAFSLNGWNKMITSTITRLNSNAHFFNAADFTRKKKRSTCTTLWSDIKSSSTREGVLNSEFNGYWKFCKAETYSQMMIMMIFCADRSSCRDDLARDEADIHFTHDVWRKITSNYNERYVHFHPKFNVNFRRERDQQFDDRISKMITKHPFTDETDQFETF